MRKFILSLVSVILLALLGVFGFFYLRNNGPRERVDAPDGSRIIVEEMSYYHRGGKLFGKVYKPADENGNYPDSLGPRPVLIYFHEPLKTAWPENVIKALVPKGVIGYLSGFHGKAKDVQAIVDKIRKERFADPGLVFVLCDGECGDAVVKAVAKIGSKVEGLILVEPSLTGKALEIYRRYGKEFLAISASQKGEAVSLIEDYLEIHGALK